MAEEKPKALEQAPKSRRMVWIIVAVVVVVLVAVGGVAAYYLLKQPDIEVTQLNVASNDNPTSSTVADQGTVSGYAYFSYRAPQVGTYDLVFGNEMSMISSKSVSLNYSTGGPSNLMSFSISPGASRVVSADLTEGQWISGDFTVSGGSGNDVYFQIVANTCSNQVSFSFVLVNAGTANGFAQVSFTVDGTSAWSNRYFVQVGQQLPVNGSVTLQDCGSHDFNVVVTSQQKP